MRNATGIASALALVGMFAVGAAFGQPASASDPEDRGYPSESGTAGSSSSGAFGGIGGGSSEAAAQEQGRTSAVAGTTSSTSDAPGEKFKSPEAAVKAFVSALREGDEARLEKIFGGQASKLLSSGDPVADRNERATFLKHFDRKHDLNPIADGRTSLVVGESAWPFAIPIANSGGGYYFDTAEGTKQVVFRRIGRNQRNAVAVCSGFVSAQKDYARAGHDGLPSGLYAQKLRSDPGKQDGLFWPTEQGAAKSPAGPLLAGAAEQGYADEAGKLTPYHGYLYRPLAGQGESARGGARSYVSDGKQSGGFALIAYPAEYGRTGVKSFIVNQDGIVYEKDLGEQTLDVARKMTVFEPRGWRAAL